MPPKAKFSREQIVSAAFRIVEEKGMSALSARSLAHALGTSTGPIFTAFDTIEEIQREVKSKAKELYGEYIKEGLKDTVAFKGAGMKYIQFAKDKPELFKLLFMSGDGVNTVTHFLPYGDDNHPIILEAIEKNYGLSGGEAKNLYNHMSVYAFGFAALFAQRINVFNMEDISRMMSEVFSSMIKNSRKENGNA